MQVRQLNNEMKHTVDLTEAKVRTLPMTLSVYSVVFYAALLHANAPNGHDVMSMFCKSDNQSQKLGFQLTHRG